MPANDIAAAEFKALCLQLLDEVARTGEPLTIRKRGRAVAQLVPIPPARPLYGALRGTVVKAGDLVSPIGEDWEAAR